LAACADSRIVEQSPSSSASCIPLVEDKNGMRRPAPFNGVP
jgi:hypothetical protein